MNSSKPFFAPVNETSLMTLNVTPPRNSTLSTDQQARTIASWFILFTIFASVLFNGLLIFVYLTHAHLRTAFNVYVVNIATTEFLLALTAMPGTFIVNYYITWPYDGLACTFFAYFKLILSTAVRYGHVLVTVNRLWAVTFPMHYRNAHNKRVALAITLVMWVFVHVLSVPSVVWSRWGKSGVGQPERRCMQGDTVGKLVTTVALEIVGFGVPELFIVMTYPFVWWKVRQLRWKAGKVVPKGGRTGVCDTSFVGSSKVASGINGSVSLGNELTVPTLDKRIEAPHPEVYVPKPRIKPSVGLPTSERPARVAPPTVVNQREKARQMAKSQNRLLAYMVLAVIVCWTPNHVFYLLVDTIGYWNATFSSIQFFVLYTYSWIDPLLCILAMSPLRQAVRNRIFCQR
ncbi:hypothetical protein BV898_12822 [Hypsibius exemplaris]|uniref:G-protein coupled receptors family 1 profile domain-containing protein n=1 Tax=Hypsibius exemplaris TaxID=2072580 RepID=A0A1W0WCI9_HYPEX|nr:hypothetical protein BV898_12822 [Hypsibius exemplaris]